MSASGPLVGYKIVELAGIGPNPMCAMLLADSLVVKMLGLFGLIAFLRHQYPQSGLVKYAGWLMFTGIILFSGSLYLLSLSGLKWLGMITPFGGLCFLSAWLLLVVFSFKSNALH